MSIATDNLKATCTRLDFINTQHLCCFEAKEEETDEKELSALKKNILFYGILVPLTVVGPDENGMYEILSGNHRYLAVRKINEENPGCYTELPCYIVGTSDTDIEIKRLMAELSNLPFKAEKNQPTHCLRVIELYMRLAQKGLIAEKEALPQAVQALGISDRYGRMYRTILTQACPELLAAVKSEATYEMVSSGKDPGPVHIPPYYAARIAALNAEEQKKFIAQINAGKERNEALKDCLEKSEDTTQADSDNLLDDSAAE